MWGTKVIRRTRRLLGAGLLLSLGACATHHAAPSTAGPLPAPTHAGRDATGAYRFNMTQNGRRMSADEFDAWMKARGIRVVKGAPATARPARATAQARPAATPAKARAKATVASAGKPRAAGAPKAANAPTGTVAQASKPKPKAKPGAKTVSEARAPARQGTGEG